MNSPGDSDIKENNDVLGNLFLEGMVKKSGSQKHLKLGHNGLIIGDAHSKSGKTKDICLNWQDVISAVGVQKASGDQNASFTIHYIHHQQKHKLRVETVTLTDEKGQADKWISCINENCKKVSGRPKKIFVVVNPIGGAKRGRHVFEKTVAPLFQLAGINVTVAYTEKSKHALELGEQHDFSDYDGIVIVGGDGTYHEILLGLTLQIQKKNGVDFNNPESEFVKPEIPIGIIPAGTGNGVSMWCNGTIDVVTAVLNVIRGENHRGEIQTVHSCGKFLTLCGLLFGCGEFSDLIKRTDDLRWMGRARYPYAMVGLFMKKPRMFKCDIEYCMASDQEKQDGTDRSNTEDEQKTDWKIFENIHGQTCGVFAMTCESISDGNKSVQSPFGNCVDLVIDSGCGRFDLLKAFVRFANGNYSPEILPDKLAYIPRVTGYRIRVTLNTIDDANLTDSAAKARELEHLLNIDGEVVHVDTPEMDIRVRPNFVPLFGRLPGRGACK